MSNKYSAVELEAGERGADGKSRRTASRRI
jgi:hypothetical protein